MEGKGVTRRQFIKYAGATAALLGLSQSLVPEIARALEELSSGKPPVLWIQGQNCTGCSISFLNTNFPNVAELVLDKLSVRYHPNVMAAAGDLAFGVLEETAKELAGKYVLVVEGPVPTEEGGEFCTFGLEKETKDFKAEDGTVYRRRKDKPMIAWMEELVPKAAAVVAIGNCAAFGGIPAANASVTGTKPVQEVVAGIDKNKAVVNVGGCPPHPDWIVWAVVQILLNKAVTLDTFGRPTALYGKKIHDVCPRKGTGEVNQFGLATGCLKSLGCKGPNTKANCPTLKWHNGVNWCIGAGAPCMGCTEPTFPIATPFYKNV